MFTFVREPYHSRDTGIASLAAVGLVMAILTLISMLLFALCRCCAACGVCRCCVTPPSEMGYPSKRRWGPWAFGVLCCVVGV